MTKESRSEPQRSLRIVVVRWLLLVVAASFAVAGFVSTREEDVASTAPAARFRCPMHPEVASATEGECPICKMALEPLEAAATAAPAATAIHAAVPAAPAQADGYVCPMHAEVTSPSPARCSICKMALERPEQEAAPAPADAAVRYAAGMTWLPEAVPPAPTQRGSGPAIGKPVRRAFVNDVRAAAFVEGPGSVTAVLYRDELVGLDPGERATFVRGADPRVRIDVRLSDEAPVEWDASTSRVKFVIEAESASIPGGDVGWVELPSRRRELLVFPESALLRASEGTFVLVPDASGHAFTRRPVQIGRILKGQVVVLAGLGEEDRIVLGNGFFLDAAQRLEPRNEPVAEVAP